MFWFTWYGYPFALYLLLYIIWTGPTWWALLLLKLLVLVKGTLSLGLNNGLPFATSLLGDLMLIYIIHGSFSLDSYARITRWVQIILVLILGLSVVMLMIISKTMLIRTNFSGGFGPIWQLPLSGDKKIQRIIVSVIHLVCFRLQ
jgi:hypothetical protein